MGFMGRSIDEIRDQLLGEWAYQYNRVGRVLLTVRGSDAWLWAGAMALAIMAQERGLQVLQDQILPDKATLEFLLRHGQVDGLPRRAASPTRLLVSVSGTPGNSAVPGSRALTSPTGVRYSVTSVVIPREGTLNGSGNGTLVITASDPGVAGNLPTGTTLTWVAAPSGFNATATVVTIEQAGEDVESPAAYAGRIIANRQNRPASGNRQDWLNWMDAVAGVVQPFVYPEVRLVGSVAQTGRTGSVLLLPLGPLPDGTSDPTRIVSTGVCDHITAYIEGTEDADGDSVALAAQIQLRPITMPPGTYQAVPATLSTINVEMTLVLGALNDFPFTPSGGDYEVQAVPAPTTGTIYVSPFPDAQPVGARLLSGHPIAVEMPSEEGGFFLTTALGVNGATGEVTLSPALPSAPAANALVLPATPLWSQVLDSVTAVFDGLGPGDTSPPSRWPPPEVTGRPTLYVSQLQAAALGVSGVIAATPVTPASDEPADPLELHMMGTLILRKT